MRNLIETLAPASLLRPLALALVHFLWQGTLVALGLAAANRVLRRAGARVRYAAACTALFVMAALPAATLGRFAAPPSALRPEVAAGTAPAAVSAAVSTAARAQGDALSALAPWIVLGWLAGVFALSARFLLGFAGARRLLRRRTRRPGSSLELRLAGLARPLGIRRAVRLLESAAVTVPSVVGVLRPVILVPAGIATGMSAEQLDALLAHELAHVRRADALVNLLQVVVETLLFYHPAVWWVSSRIRIERENACDDLAVEATGDAVVYARALLELAERRQAAPALAATAVAADGGSLWNRIARLAGPASGEGSEGSTPSRGLAGVLALGAILALGAAARVTPESRSAQPSRDAASVPSAAPAPAPSATPAPAPAPRGAKPKSRREAQVGARPGLGRDAGLAGPALSGRPDRLSDPRRDPRVHR